MEDYRKTAEELQRLAACLANAAEWLALGEDYCDTQEMRTEVLDFAIALRDNVNELLNEMG